MEMYILSKTNPGNAMGRYAAAKYTKYAEASTACGADDGTDAEAV